MRTALLGLAIALVMAAPAAAAPRKVTVQLFDRPVYVTSPPKDGRVFVAEKGGKIQIVGRGTFLDATGLTDGSFEERGLLSLAFPPDYASSGLFYVFLTDKETGDVKVLRFRRSATNPDRADPTPLKTLLSIPHGQEYHNGGQIQFGPDGMLWVSTGDNHNSGNAQNTGSPLGKILRLNPATGAGAAGNPGHMDNRVWAYGLRNPWRFSFDRLNGDLSIGDVGDNTWEEIDWAPAPTRGKDFNFGWPDCEGPTGDCPDDPIITHNHSDGWCAIVGGYVVRDPGLPTLNGRYLYGDNCNQSLYSARPRTGADDRQEALTIPGLTSFGQDACGRIYAASLNGPVYRIQDGAATTCTFGAPGGGGADTTAPTVKVSLAGTKTALKKRRLLVRVRCSEACRIAVGTRLMKVKRLGTRHRSLTAGTRVTVT